MRVIVVEDHSAMRFALRTLLEFVEKVEVVGEAENADEAQKLVEKERPDLLILDLQLKGQSDGIELCREIKLLAYSPKILVYSAFNSSDEVSRAFLSGADGYVHKGIDYRELPESIRRVRAGEEVRLLGVEIEEAESVTNSILDDACLTAREREIYTLLLRRYTNAEIANSLNLSLPTVKTHVSSILGKTDCKRREELIK